MKVIQSQKWTIYSFLVLFAGVFWIWFSAPEGGTTGGLIPAPRHGFLAPDFTLADENGEPHTLSNLQGQPVLINLWASWCNPCRAEMPAMQRVYEEFHKEGFEILAVNTTYQDDPNRALSFAQELGLSFTLLWDLDGSISNLYQVRAMPTSFFVDKKGVISEVIVGGPMAEALLRVRIQELLREGR
jgi:cytochrome c biogenesis protein CcmG, thiol:disulfide interchange protein DsbE